jgi:RNA polymerase sigma factor (sigma-70 family)
MDDSELRTLLEKHHSAAFGWAMSCCGRNSTDAEDVLQTVYVKILEGKAKYKGTAQFKTWLFSVIRKTAAEVRRRNMFHKLKLMDFLPSALSGKKNNPADQLEHHELETRLTDALATLSRRQREVLHLVFYEDFSLSEAAEVMNIYIGSARTHYERGKKKLRMWMEEENFSNES